MSSGFGSLDESFDTDLVRAPPQVVDVEDRNRISCASLSNWRLTRDLTTPDPNAHTSTTTTTTGLPGQGGVSGKLPSTEHVRERPGDAKVERVPGWGLSEFEACGGERQRCIGRHAQRVHG